MKRFILCVGVLLSFAVAQTVVMIRAVLGK